MRPNPGERTSVQDVMHTLLSETPFVLLDGAMGTELERRGYRTRLPLWSAMANVEAPALVKEVHDAYIAAGSDIITANTFRTTSYTFAKRGMPDMGFLVTRLAVEIARESVVQAGRDVLLAGSLAPLEDCYSPGLVPGERVIRKIYDEQIGFLKEAGVDLMLCETMINRAEAICAAQCCAAHDIPFMMSFTVEDGCLLDGTSLESTIPDLMEFNPLALLLNCRTPDVISQNLGLLRSLFTGPVGAYGNGPGRPDPEIGWEVVEGAIGVYCDAVKDWYAAGARIIGGCCGTTPEHIAAIAQFRSERRMEQTRPS